MQVCARPFTFLFTRRCEEEGRRSPTTTKVVGFMSLFSPFYPVSMADCPCSERGSDGEGASVGRGDRIPPAQQWTSHSTLPLVRVADGDENPGTDEWCEPWKSAFPNGSREEESWPPRGVLPIACGAPCRMDGSGTGACCLLGGQAGSSRG